METLKEVDKFAEQLEKSTEDELAFLWRVRNTLDKHSRYKKRQMIWAECERRYDGLTRKPITLRIPYFEQLDATKVKGVLHRAIQAREEWPEFIRQWHVQKARVITKSQPSIDSACGGKRDVASH